MLLKSSSDSDSISSEYHNDKRLNSLAADRNVMQSKAPKKVLTERFVCPKIAVSAMHCLVKKL